MDHVDAGLKLVWKIQLAKSEDDWIDWWRNFFRTPYNYPARWLLALLHKSPPQRAQSFAIVTDNLEVWEQVYMQVYAYSQDSWSRRIIAVNTAADVAVIIPKVTVNIIIIIFLDD
ncbi:MAG: hypothetical protein M1816_000569 [Peltula sp. TS41687]|nr:MAG: hypothetical protein M1816_000569 [Peltula sp. TS41687]